MNAVYATRLTILADARHPSTEVLSAVIGVCKAWLHEKAQEFDLQIELDADHRDVLGTNVRGDTRRIIWRDLRSASISGAHAVLIQPLDDQSDPHGRFSLRIEISVREDNEEVSLTIRGLLTSRFDRIRPPSFLMQPPRLVRMIIDEFDLVSINSTKATYTPRFLADDEMDALIRQLFEYSRTAPLIVVSRTRDDRMMCDPNAIAQALMGLARVFVLPSAAASEKLTNALGADLSVRDGGVRIYWPDLAIQDSPYAHPEWLPNELVLFPAQRQLVSNILRLVSDASAIGVDADRQIEQLATIARAERTAALQERLRHIEARHERVTVKAGELEDQYARLNEKYELTHELFQLADRQNAESRHQIQALEETVHQRDARIDALTRTLPAEIDVLELFDRRNACRSFLDLICLAREIAPEACIVFLDACDASARKTPFSDQLDVCWAALTGLIRAAKMYQGDTNAQLKTTMEATGFTVHQFKADISDTARRQFKSDYEIRYTDHRGTVRRALLGPHLKFGKGNRDKTPYIYWFVDSNARRFIVGHTGGKLRDTTGGYAR